MNYAFSHDLVPDARRLIYSLIIQNGNHIGLLALSHTCISLNHEIKPLIKDKRKIYYSMGKGGYIELLKYYNQNQPGGLENFYLGAIEGGHKAILEQYIEPEYTYRPPKVSLYHAGTRIRISLLAGHIAESLALCQDIQFIYDYTQNLDIKLLNGFIFFLIREDSSSFVKFLEMVDKKRNPYDSLLYKVLFSEYKGVYRTIHEVGANKIHKFVCGSKLKKEYFILLKKTNSLISLNKTSTYGEMIERITPYLVIPISKLVEGAMWHENVEALKYHTLKDGFDIPIDLMINSIKNSSEDSWFSDYKNYILPLFYSKIPDLHVRSIISSPINTNNWISILNYALNNGYYKKEDTNVIKQIINQSLWNWVNYEYKKHFDQWCKSNNIN